MRDRFYGADMDAIIELYERSSDGRFLTVRGDGWGFPLPHKFFTADDLAFMEYDEELAGFSLANVGYCIKQAHDWEDCVGDFSDDAPQHKFKRRAVIEVF